MSGADRSGDELTELERLVLEVALATRGHADRRLRDQVAAARVAARTHSGVGFMTRLRVPAELAPPDAPADETLPAVSGSHPRLPAGAEFVLQLRSGQLHTIEAYCFEGMWPDDESLFRLEVRP